MAVRKNGRKTLSLSSEHLYALELCALHYGYAWGNRGNVSGMMRAIAEGDLVLGIVRDMGNVQPNPDHAVYVSKDSRSLDRDWFGIE